MTYADPEAVVRWLRLWLSGNGRGSMASDVGLTEADCVAVQREIGGWPLPGCPRALAVLERLEGESASGAEKGGGSSDGSDCARAREIAIGENRAKGGV